MVLLFLQPAEVSDTERNFAFKVTSPVRVLLLQAEGSLEMQSWLDTLNNAITHAIHGAPPEDGRRASTSPQGVGGEKAPNGSTMEERMQESLSYPV